MEVVADFVAKKFLFWIGELFAAVGNRAFLVVS